MKTKIQTQYEMWHNLRTWSFRIVTIIGVVIFALDKLDLLGQNISFLGLTLTTLMLITVAIYLKTASLAKKKGVEEKAEFQSDLTAAQIHEGLKK
jgi:hypothetical protein